MRRASAWKRRGAVAARKPRWNSSSWPHQPGTRPGQDRGREARAEPYAGLQLAPLIDEVVGTARQLAEQNKNRLVVETQENLGALTVDPMRLKQILLNLLSNACKFTKQGEVALHVRKVVDGHNWIEFAVARIAASA